MARKKRTDTEPPIFDAELADMPTDLRWREWLNRVEAVLFAAPRPVERETLARVVGRDASIDLLIDDIREGLRSKPYDVVSKCHIGRTGRADFEVVSWNTPHTTLEEPACGAHYQPYGPVELGYVTTMISDAAIESLLSPPNSSTHRLFATSAARLQDAGGNWTSTWLETQAQSKVEDATHIIRAWPPSDCPACGSHARQ